MFLKLKSNKTELIITGPKALLPSTQDLSLFVDGHNTTTTPQCETLAL